jgi:hypothetical protein
MCSINNIRYDGYISRLDLEGFIAFLIKTNTTSTFFIELYRVYFFFGNSFSKFICELKFHYKYCKYYHTPANFP